MDDKKLEKLNKLLELVQEDTVKPADIEQFLEVALNVIKEAKEHFDSISEENQGKIDEALERIESFARNEFEERIREIRELSALRPKDGYTPVKGVDYFDGETIVGPKGEDGKDGKDGSDGSPDTPDQVIDKVNDGKKLIKKERVEGLVDAIKNIARGVAQALPVTTSFFNGLRAKNLTIDGATAELRGDTVHITDIPGTGGGADTFLELTDTPDTYATEADRLVTVNPAENALLFGRKITISASEPVDPREGDLWIDTDASGGGSSLTTLTVTGTIDDSNVTFTVATEPEVVVINGFSYNGTTGSITWTWVAGTLTLSQPVGTGGDIYALN